MSFLPARYVLVKALMSTAREISPFRQRTLQLQKRTFTFATQVLNICPRKLWDEPSRAVWRQLVRSAPSASGNLEEADEAYSDSDFVFKMKLATREMKESRRWLRFIATCKLAHHDKLGSLQDEARQLASIFATIVINVKKPLEAEKVGKRK